METMTIQWSLVLFTALTGIGGWTFVCVAADEFLGRAKTAAFPAAVVAFALSAVGGLASVTHLSHPDRIMGALGHPTSGIFTEAVLVGCVCVFVAIYLVMLKRGASDGARKAVAVIGAVFGVLISFMAGESYLMSSRPNWDTQLLPLGYMLTAMPGGIACYLAVAAAKAKEAKLDQYAKALLVAGVLGVLGTVAFAVAAGQSDGSALGFAAASAVLAGVVPAIVGALLPKKPQQAMTLAVAALACAAVGIVCYRCLMWVVSEPVSNLFLNIL